MKRANTKHLRFKGYADGGKVTKSESEYGKPTFARAVAAHFGVGDGWGNPKNAPKPKEERRMNVANAPAELGNVIAKRKKMLDET